MINAGVIEGILDLDISGFIDALSTAGSTLSQSTAQWQKQTDGAGSKIGSSMQKIGVGLTAGLTTPILGAGAAAMAMASQYDSAAAKIQSVLGLTEEQAQDLTQVARNIYTNGFGPSLEDVVNTTTKVRQVLGDLNSVDISYVATGIQSLADTMDIDIGESIRGVSALIEGFGLSAQDAMDLFAAGAQNGLNYTDELGDNLAEYGPRFAQMGFSAKEYFQILENGTESGAYNLDKVNDFLNEFQTSLSDGRMDESIGKFSQSTQELFQSWKEGGASGKEVYMAILNDLKQMPDGYEKASLASTLWSSLGEDNALKMINAMVPAGDTFDDVAGKSQEMADKASQSLGSKFTSLVRSVKDAFADLGKSSIGPLSSLVSSIQKVVNAFRKLPDGAKQFITVMAAILASIGPALTIVGTLVANFKQVFSVAKSVGKAFSVIKVAIAGLSAPVVGVVGVIAALTAAFTYLWKTNKKFRDGVINAWSQILAFITPIIDNLIVMFQTYWPIIQQVVTGVMNEILGVVQAVWPLIQLIMQTVVQVITELFTVSWPIIQQIVVTATQAIMAVIQLAWPMIQMIIQNVMAVIQTVITTTMTVIQSIIDVVTGIISGNWSQVWNAIQQVIVSVWSAIQSIVSSAINIVSNTIQAVLWSISSTWSSTWNTITGFLSNAWNNITTAVSNGINAVLDFFRNLPGNILAVLGNLGSLLYNAGRDLMNGFMDGIAGMGQALLDRVTGLVGGVIDRAKSLLGIASPSKVFKEIGNFTVMGLTESLDHGRKDVRSSISSIVDVMNDGFGGIKDTTIDFDVNVPDRDAVEKLKQTAGFMGDIASATGAMADVKYDYNDVKSFNLSIDYNSLGAVIADTLRNVPIEASVNVDMKDGDVIIDGERVGRKVAPVVSRVQAYGIKKR